MRYTRAQVVYEHSAQFSEWTLYKHRFVWGYLLLAFLVGAKPAFVAAAYTTRFGAKRKTKRLLTRRRTAYPTATAIVDLPYHLLQKASVLFWALAHWACGLPSLIIASLTAIMVTLILRRWFKTNVAIVAALVVLSSAWFVSTAHLGAPFIMVPFWTSHYTAGHYL
jgi:hypothetical protein